MVYITYLRGSLGNDLINLATTSLSIYLHCIYLSLRRNNAVGRSAGVFVSSGGSNESMTM